ncbi:MaoC family dehydratase [Novosphingobium pituita]|jgi:acyl dehydratase|uniref:MaoC family dehydratase n=1 Tax=Novosphingobium pituita TaxID=3056842 RepID=A0ABQ6P3J1_9SPHN|nr:MaoC family dehydratase [Novosphingobium sp. IK01]MDK4807282.1 MaoC family dehydratase [Novosphingobium aromaticivorans]GMM59435.1 MaoC family dehydratase [Novosphingobium sp. IK01]HIQ18829.1 MaoC family dehydratase [Novosphingobium capsulatum]
MRFYEDLEVGAVSRFGSRLVGRDEVVAFARAYDPQPFHLSDEEAAKTHFGRLAASGWHTCAMTMAMIVEEQERTGHQGLGSPGIDELRWRHPVYPGDTLRVETEVLEKRRSRSRPEMGIFRAETRVYNQDDVAVLTMVSNAMVSTRDPDGTD